MSIKLERLCNSLNYKFTNVSLLKKALSHRSFGEDNYERLEFLGDSILSFVIANELVLKFPELSEGELSRMRSFLVKGDMLAEIAKEINLGDCLYLGQGELRSGGFRRASILADSLEAIFAAIFLDSDIFEAQKSILNLYQTRLQAKDLTACIKDFKTQLQEFLQAEKKQLPEYILSDITGSEHEQIFHVTCTVQGYPDKTHGHGFSRRKAEQLAAQLFLEKIMTNL